MITYTFSPDSYLVRVRGSVRSAGGSGATRALLVSLPSGFRSTEADSAEDERHSVVRGQVDAGRSGDDRFLQTDSTAARTENGPLNWVASKNKYFLVALLSDTAHSPFVGAVFEGVPRPAKTMATRAMGRVVEALPQDGDVRVHALHGAAGVAQASVVRPPVAERESTRVGVPACGAAVDHVGDAAVVVGARRVAHQLWVAGGDLRRRRAPVTLAAQSERDAGAAQDATDPAPVAGDPEEVQEHAREVEFGDDAIVSRARHEPVHIVGRVSCRC